MTTHNITMEPGDTLVLVIKAPEATGVVAAPAPRQAIRLAERQDEMLRLLVLGKSNKQIATAMGVSEATIKSHMKILIGKIGCCNRVGVAVWGMKNGYAP
jgi:two-component system nitrate/nitrite response regulator NarL